MHNTGLWVAACKFANRWEMSGADLFRGFNNPVPINHVYLFRQQCDPRARIRYWTGRICLWLLQRYLGYISKLYIENNKTTYFKNHSPESFIIQYMNSSTSSQTKPPFPTYVPRPPSIFFKFYDFSTLPFMHTGTLFLLFKKCNSWLFSARISSTVMHPSPHAVAEFAITSANICTSIGYGLCN